ncbi:hypothetical protein MKW98_009240, partial [Papaver atlanticum]
MSQPFRIEAHKSEMEWIFVKPMRIEKSVQPIDLSGSSNYCRWKLKYKEDRVTKL